MEKYFVKSVGTLQGPHCTGKTGKMAELIPCHRKHRELRFFAQTQGILFAQDVNSLILKIHSLSGYLL